MLRFVVILGLRGLSVPAIIDYVRAIVKAMTGNVYFPAPFVPLADVTIAVNQLDTAWQKTQANNSSPSDTATVRVLRFELITLLRALAAYVEFVANEDHEMGESIVFSSNMGIKAFPTNTGRTFAVRNTAISGQLLLRTRSQGRKSYEWQYTRSPENKDSWISVPSTSIANTMISDLEPGSRQYFRVRVNKGHTPGPWQGPIDLIIT